MAEKRPALGRGLSALIPEAAAPTARPAAVPERDFTPSELDIDRLVPNPRQPRTVIDDLKLEELTQSMGAVNDQSFLNGSIFYETSYDSGFAQELSIMDQKLMAFLYGRLNPGYDLRTVEYFFNRYWVD